VVDAAFGEILVTAEKLRWTIANGEAALKDDYRPTNLLMAHKVSKVVYEPLGVTAAVVSWNYPYHSASFFDGFH
jgi:acyl-CoA reductase-like NAD-dependent aldehyde dehydrogenase